MKGRRIRRWAAAVLAVALTLFAGGAWYVGGNLIAPARRPVGRPPEELPVESLEILSGSGATLGSWFVAAENSTATVILLHPNRADRRVMLERARLLHSAGYSTLLVDLQGHGESTGEQITAGYRERHDVVAAVRYVRSRNPKHKIGIVGRSLGGAATVLAMPLNIDALVLESVYPTVSEAVHNRVAMRLGPLHHLLAPALLVQLRPRLGISPSQLRPVESIGRCSCPVLIAGGDRDLHTTIEETRRLYHAAPKPKQLAVFTGAAHSDLLQHDPVQYRADVLGFLNTHLHAPLPGDGAAE